ncbi:MAG: histidine phosphotransferase ChpT [Hyphomicrobiales bacterium]
MKDTRISDLDLASLLCSRVCHDVISPVGAIANGLELFDDPEMDKETKETALAMVRASAKTASAKLKFCRVAFGAAGSAGAYLDMAEAGETAKAFVGDDKVKLDWQAPRENRPKQQVKLLLNMLLIGMAAIPRGGMVKVEAAGESLTVRARGERAKVPEALAEVIDGRADLALLDARLVQPYYAGLLARSAGLALSLAMEGDEVVVRAA